MASASVLAMLRKAGLAGVALLGVATLLSWTTPRRPNVLLITLDSVRPDYLSCYGGTQVPTPHIDALAAQGVVFTDAVCDVPWTRASVASLMTGRYAATHGVRGPYDRLRDGVLTMAESFRRDGYRTGAVVATFDIDHIFRLDRGFETYDDRFEMPLLGSVERPAHVASVFYGDHALDRRMRWGKLHGDSLRPDEQTTDAAIAWLRRAGPRPFVLWVHYFAAHERRPVGASVAKLVAQYAPGVRSADTAVGRLLTALTDLGLDGRTLVVLHADQGQNLLEHGSFGHGADLYEESIRVPLIMRWPGRLPASRRISDLVRLVDIFPTVAALVGVEAPRVTDGRRITALVSQPEAQAAEAEAYFETYGSALVGTAREVTAPDGTPLHLGFVGRGVRQGDWKFVRTEPSRLVDVPASAEPPESARRLFATEELYDLAHDPQERSNLVETAPTKAAALRQLLARYTESAR